MSHNEDELIKELKELKTNAQLDPEKKDSMKKALQQHAKKKRSRSKAKHTFIWLSTAAALLACSVTVYTLINNNQITLPAGDNEQNEEIGNAGEGAKDPNDMEGLGVEDPDADISGRVEEETPEQDDHSGEGVSQQEFKVDQLGEEARTISVEGTEEETTVYNYRMEPYGIEYQVDELYNKYVIEKNTVRYHDEEDKYVSIQIYVEEQETIESMANELQEQYLEELEDVSEISESTEDGNPYPGLTQHGSHPVSNLAQGYYVYQIEDNVLVIQYEHTPDAGDGFSSRLQLLIESIRYNKTPT
ncbi:hypothetical protein [Gracilibacillus saliphilus]|uniref:hypothetical protein n=1 Tax=Gracilibacillus saliphilus TaxID=543890 RepID=UPI0013D7B244|nr:hypothetical protein [Gracilibacillus saliphilus]